MTILNKNVGQMMSMILLATVALFVGLGMTVHAETDGDRGVVLEQNTSIYEEQSKESSSLATFSAGEIIDLTSTN